MAKATTRKKSKSTSPTCQNLIEQLKFVSVAQKNEEDVLYKKHCILHEHNAMAYDGVITVGCKIEEDFSVCPHTFQFIAALERTNKEVSITELDGRLSVKSEGFSAFVPCNHEPMPLLLPDPASWPINDTLKIGFDTIAHFAVKEAQKVILSSILLRANTMICTDSAVMLEFWHGHCLPTMVLPKNFVSAVMNVDKPLVSFGYTEREIDGKMVGVSCTFWFEGYFWVKTSLYEESWPNTDLILNKPCKPTPLPIGFYEALNNIEPFSKGKEAEKVVYFANGALQSHRDKIDGAVCECEGVLHGPAFNIKRLKRIEHCVQTVDFYSNNAAYFYGNGVRGCILGVSK